jgi:hypothetical protein
MELHRAGSRNREVLHSADCEPSHRPFLNSMYG